MILMQPILAAATAMALVRTAVDHAQRLGITIAVAVVDSGGHLQAAWRMDGVAPAVTDFAQDKAYTAAMLKIATAALGEQVAASPSFGHGLAGRHRLLPWGGGLPILQDGRAIGGIGVSGASDTDDIACAQVALQAASLAGVAAA